MAIVTRRCLGAHKLVVGHSCVLSWWDAVRRSPPPGHSATYTRRIAHGLFSADLVIAPTTAMLGELRRHYGWSGGGRVIWNGVPVELESRAKEDFILTVGRLWDEAKNLVALESIGGQLPWTVYAAGEGRAAFESGGVSHLGCLSAADVLQWMARASIYALPARYEPFGLSILEAAVSGCALVLGDIPSLRELWDGAACFVPPDDRAQLARTLTTLIADRSLRSNLARQARDRAQQFSLAQMARQYLTVYQHLLGSSEPRCA